jgi:hypothetical protein
MIILQYVLPYGQRFNCDLAHCRLMLPYGKVLQIIDVDYSTGIFTATG